MPSQEVEEGGQYLIGSRSVLTTPSLYHRGFYLLLDEPNT